MEKTEAYFRLFIRIKTSILKQLYLELNLYTKNQQALVLLCYLEHKFVSL